MHGIHRRHRHRNLPCHQEKSRYVNFQTCKHKVKKSNCDDLKRKSYFVKDRYKNVIYVKIKYESICNSISSTG